MSLDINNLLNYTEEDTIAILTLNRPNQQNALSTDLMRALVSKLDKIKNNKNIKVVTLFANGNNFCAGHDLKELKLDRSEKRFKEIFELCSQLMTRIVKLPKPVIAGVQGIATAAGCQLVASCDLAIAAKNATFATPGVNIGLFCSTPMVAISRNLSNKHSMEMLLTGELISSDKAAKIGLINDVIEINKLKDFVLDKAQKISKKSSVTLKIGKEAFYKQLDMKLSDAYDYASKVMVQNMLKLDAKEGIDAFIDKREPNWKDK